MKVKIAEIDESELVVPLTLKVPKRVYDRLERIVDATKERQEKARIKAAKAVRSNVELGRPARSPRKLSKQSLLLSIIEDVLFDPDFEVEVE